jgi:anhydro-N-acetylmuramic acid kinase
MSGSSLDGLDIAFVELSEVGGAWSYVIREAECREYPADWVAALKGAVNLPAREYQLLHTAYGRYIGAEVKAFIERHQLEHKVHFIASHGHTTFHIPEQHTTSQLGCGASIAALTGLPVISDLRAMDVALGGQGAPIVPIGEKLLLGGYDYWLNLGGIANLSARDGDLFRAFDVCPANRVLDALAAALGKSYDENGALAAGGVLDNALLQELNSQPYYSLPYPKSLANDFGTDILLPLIGRHTLSVQGKLRTYVAHIAAQTAAAATTLSIEKEGEKKLLVTGGGAFNAFLVQSISEQLAPLGITVVVPDAQTAAYKEALVMALIGALRWRQQPNVLASVTGASRDSVNGTLWLGEG